MTRGSIANVGWPGLLGLVVWACGSFVQGQAVQLPTFQQTGVQTTVLVPDGGTMLMGGGATSSYGSTSRGMPGLSKVPGAGRLFGNRAIGSASAANTFTVSAQIHHLREMDEGLLAEAAARRAGANDPQMVMNNTKADFISRNVERRTDDRTLLVNNSKPKTPSVEELRTQNQLALEKQNAEALSYVEQGREAEALGKPGVAKIYYNMAVRRATGELKAEVQQRLAALSTGTDRAGQLAADR